MYSNVLYVFESIQVYLSLSKCIHSGFECIECIYSIFYGVFEIIRNYMSVLERVRMQS
jgi:hypothetical protein